MIRTKCRQLVTAFDQRGASLVEYTLLIAFIALVCVAAISFFGIATSSNYSESTDSLFTP